MKKGFAVLLAAAMLLSLCACGAGSASPKKPIEEMDDEDWESAVEILEEEYAAEEPPAETEPAQKIYQIGETVVTADGMLEFTLDSFCFADTRDGGRFVPADSESEAWWFDEGKAEAEKTYLFYTGTMNFVGNSKEICEYYLYDVQADYDDGYIIKGQGDWSKEDSGIFELNDTSNNGEAVASFEPLTGTKVREVRGYLEVPEVVETDTESPLLLIINIGGGVQFSGNTAQIQFAVQFR